MQDSGHSEQYVLFRIGDETYAVPISQTQEVLRYKEPKKIPHAPTHVLGVINLRGNLIPIVGLREKFALSSAEPTAETRVIVLIDNDRLTGIVCDSVERVVFLHSRNIEENPSFSGKRGAAAIRGVAHLDEADSVIFLLSLRNLTDDVAESLNTSP